MAIGNANAIASGRKLTLAGGTFNTSAFWAFTVQSGQTVNGNGTWSAGSGLQTIAGLLSLGATHNVAGSPAAMTLNTGTLQLRGTGAFDLFTASSNDVMNAPAIDYGGILNIAKPGAFTLALGQNWKLFNGTRSGLNTFSNSFAYNDPNLPTLANTLAWSFNYTTGTLSVVTAVPEPSLAVLAIGAGALLVRRRRSRA